MKINRVIRSGLVVLLTSFILVSNAEAVWYRCTVFQLVPLDNGDILVQIKPSTVNPPEDRFTGIAMVSIDPADPGANNMLMALMTGLVMKSVVTISLSSPPSPSPIGVIEGVGLQ